MGTISARASCIAMVVVLKTIAELKGINPSNINMSDKIGPDLRIGIEDRLEIAEFGINIQEAIGFDFSLNAIPDIEIIFESTVEQVIKYVAFHLS
ncbi:MAG TPA: hypothetical protein VK145_03080 [Candidatus Nanoarchaeia archaeon]|nr:hypothetical protein [Candidatus Nanoarchaeia archaeon]